MILTAGDEWEVDEEVARIRIEAGLAKPVDPPADQRRTVTHGEQVAETTSVNRKPRQRQEKTIDG